jgi:hypothetical protein
MAQNRPQAEVLQLARPDFMQILDHPAAAIVY